LDSYDYYTRHAQQQELTRQEEVGRARAVLDKHLEILAKEEAYTELEERPVKPAAAPKKKEPTKKAKAKKSKTVKKAVRDRAKVPTRVPTHALMANYNPLDHYDQIRHYNLGPVEEVVPRRVTTKSGRLQVATRQCHDCKSSTKIFRRCHYWMANGSKCGKIFCRKCIENKYEGPQDDWDSTVDRTDWQ